jgi:hypothetical protein
VTRKFFFFADVLSSWWRERGTAHGSIISASSVLNSFYCFFSFSSPIHSHLSSFVVELCFSSNSVWIQYTNMFEYAFVLYVVDVMRDVCVMMRSTEICILNGS